MLEKIKKENINYDRWVAERYVTVTPGNVVDYDFVKADILRITADYNLKSTAYDRWNASQTIIDLQNEGMGFSPFGQGFGSMSAPTKQFEALVLTGEVEHFGNPVLRWMLASTVVQTDPAGNIKPDKRKSVQKIDGIVASIMALGEWMTAQAKDETNPYNEELFYRLDRLREKVSFQSLVCLRLECRGVFENTRHISSLIEEHLGAFDEQQHRASGDGVCTLLPHAVPRATGRGVQPQAAPRGRVRRVLPIACFTGCIFICTKYSSPPS